MRSLLLILSAALLLISCSSSKPEDIATNFYNLLNQGKFDEAKEYASPSVIEFIDTLKKFNGEHCTQVTEILPFKYLEIEKQEEPKEGDVAIVNYSIGSYKNFLNLVWIDGAYKVSWSYELRSIMLNQITSVELAKIGSEMVDPKKIKHYRFRIKNVIGVKLPGTEYGFAYDPAKNSSPAPSFCDISNMMGPKSRHFYLKLNGKDVKLTEGEGDNFLGFRSHFKFSSYSNEEDASKIKSKEFEDGVEYPDTGLGYDSQSLITIEGVLHKTSLKQMTFNDCTIFPN